MFQTKAVEKIKTHILCSIIFSPLVNRPVYKKMLKNAIERCRPQMTIWRMGIACWITKATNTYSEYVTHSFSTATMVTQTRPNFMFYYVAFLAIVVLKVRLSF
jgi:hypothetical protein